MPRVRLSSMYDLQTNTKFGIIGVHTPTAGQIATKYDGLLRNYKYMKIKSCSVKIACASVLPADPLQVGVTAGKISPADMMNPILYRAVSNDSWNFVLNRIYSSSWNGDSADGWDDAFSNASISQANSEQIYYSLLSSPGWRKVMPQQGLSVKNLRPLVHEIVSVFGQQNKISSVASENIADNTVIGDLSNGNPSLLFNNNTVFRGRTLSMPAIPTSQIDGSAQTTVVAGVPGIPKTMVLAIVMPFSQLQVMYYRMIVTWDIVFFGLRPSTELSISTAITDGAYARYSRWSIASSKELESDDENKAESVGCVDALNMSPELRMES